MDWKEVKTTGTKVPGRISHHTGLVFQDKMYLFGGSKNSGDENETMFTLNLSTFKWDVVDQVLFPLFLIFSLAGFSPPLTR
jgi:hypothetical protein